VPSPRVDEQRAAADEPIELNVRIMLQVRAHRFWAGVFLAGLPEGEPPRQLHAVHGRRPEGKTVAQTARRACQLLAEASDQITRPVLSGEDEGW
jgi:hypothetical protein